MSEQTLYFLESADGSTFAMQWLAAGGRGVLMFGSEDVATLQAANRNDAQWTVKACDAKAAYDFLKNAQAQGATHTISESPNPGKLKIAPISSVMLAIDLLRKEA